MKESIHPFISLPVPVMHKKEFAKHVGVSEGVVEGWCNRGYIGTVTKGKHALVNLAELTEECMQKIPRNVSIPAQKPMLSLPDLEKE